MVIQSSEGLYSNTHHTLENWNALIHIVRCKIPLCKKNNGYC